jgi:hypothetical protein
MRTPAPTPKHGAAASEARTYSALGLSFLLHCGLLAFLGLRQVGGDHLQLHSITLHTATDQELQPVRILTRTTVELERQQEVIEVDTPHINLANILDRVGGVAGSHFHENSRIESALSRMPGLFTHGMGQGSGQAERGSGNAEGGTGMYQRPFESLVQELREGLDLVIVFDSTSSMGAEINALKLQIMRLGRVMLQVLPETRLAFVTYKDIGDLPPVAFSELTNDLVSLFRFLSSVEPWGGGFDIEEAVGVGLHQALSSYQFREDAHKVVIILGDAPPRRADLPHSLSMAAQFHSLTKARISTLTVRAASPSREFASIAEVGGGESVVLIDQRNALQELLLLVFGAANRAEALQLLRAQ